jgi:addiction module RelE/StbE family toxin
MRDVSYKSSFLRALKKLSPKTIDEVEEKIKLFKTGTHDKELRVHKLHGRLAGRHSFSVNYRYRIVYRILGQEYTLLDIGTHEVYE